MDPSRTTVGEDEDMLLLFLLVVVASFSLGGMAHSPAVLSDVVVGECADDDGGSSGPFILKNGDEDLDKGE
jgi:hypothetical protein